MGWGLGDKALSHVPLRAGTRAAVLAAVAWRYPQEYTSHYPVSPEPLFAQLGVIHHVGKESGFGHWDVWGLGFCLQKSIELKPLNPDLVWSLMTKYPYALTSGLRTRMESVASPYPIPFLCGWQTLLANPSSPR